MSTPKAVSHMFGPFMVSNRKWGKILPPYFSIGVKTWPVSEADVSVELDSPTTRMTATRILSGGVLLGPVGMILGGMARKDVTKGRMILTVNGEHVQTFAFPGKDIDKALRFVQAVADAQRSADGSTEAPRPSPAPAPAAAWAPDPSRRHELRWWDGTAWTEHISDAGQQSVDPLA